MGAAVLLGPLLLDPGLIILLSEMAESPHKIPLPDLRTNMSHSTTPVKASYSPRNRT
ncbi:unnamed protein product [Penicillium camemberti]|uniref:Str. FM013 n=1 Tax=Penicillium camemberti (strain FM 013) TaxID=1429867 RepID=A0A0G4PGH7_PENC3|nr:unnamed protein product [Penicillium camemberti]